MRPASRIIPVGVLVGNAIAHAANGLESDEFRVASESLLKRVDCPSEAHEEYAFPPRANYRVCFFRRKQNQGLPRLVSSSTR